MAYNPTSWSNHGPPPINGANLNKIEQGIRAASEKADEAAAAAGAAIPEADADARYLPKKSLESDEGANTADLDPSTEWLGRWNIVADGSDPSGWPDRFGFRFGGVRTGSFNEYGELRAASAKNSTTALRADGNSSSHTGTIFDVRQYRGGPVLFAVSGQGGVKVPAPTAATHAAQVTAIDPATGRLAIGGMEIGDTGWRDVRSGLVNGATANVLSIRRAASTIHIRFFNLTAGSPGSVPSYVLPAGFTGFGGTGVSLSANSLTAFGAVWLNNTVPGGIRPVSGAAAYTGTHILVSFPTSDPWPTTLPGVPA